MRDLLNAEKLLMNKGQLNLFGKVWLGTLIAVYGAMSAFALWLLTVIVFCL